ncbi:response regulator transcription factor [Hymenobacter sp. BT186]|uniref:Response regulator transcription factor n=1 Tax=Hymenobacter telluris TaxID=2816474 RepID=A0A939EW39_9BACT|nr:LytTR family DNA-binding domain-containing protein [Hymenobacter telluris]MBO0357622.1 response regulator transcription factor [Hymenobacter telluris]MBW3373648.1 LytTR family DNA-binding domain-containing protein [Hymenobacter norwichensis]
MPAASLSGTAPAPAPLTCAVVDDELLPRLAVVKALRQHPGLRCVGQFESLEALTSSLDTLPDVLFLDIGIGQTNGLDYFKSLPEPPLTVFITSHLEYAVESFEAAAFDYIVKPLTDERFARVAARLLDHQLLRHKATLYELHVGAEFISIREGHRTSRVPVQDIVYLEALDNYTRIHTAQRRYLTLANLRDLCEQLPAARFLRIHRTYAVAVAKVSQLAGASVVVDGLELPVGRTYRPQVAAALL